MSEHTRKTILIVEDNDMNMKLTRDVLEAKGYTTLCAETGEDGLRMATGTATRLGVDGHPDARH